MKRIILLFGILLLFASQGVGQTYPFPYTLHGRVDTTNPEVMEVVQLWLNYLASKPDSICDNPFWNEAEKRNYKEFDFAQESLFQFDSRQLLNYFKPTILSVEKVEQSYAIRTIFFADNVEGESRKSNPWTIFRIYAVKEFGDWKLKNPLSIHSRNWKRIKAGKITYIFPSTHWYSYVYAEKAVHFCDSIAEKFEVGEWEPFDFYITESADELGELLGFEFFFPGFTQGRGMYDRRILLSGKNSEFYPHELAHMVLGGQNQHQFVNEGMATWIGGVAELTFEDAARNLAAAVQKEPQVRFINMLSRKWGRQHHALYVSGAIFCKLIYEKKGLEGLNALMNSSASDMELFSTLCKTLGIKEKDLNDYWRAEVLKYLK